MIALVKRIVITSRMRERGTGSWTSRCISFQLNENRYISNIVPILTMSGGKELEWVEDFVERETKGGDRVMAFEIWKRAAEKFDYIDEARRRGQVRKWGRVFWLVEVRGNRLEIGYYYSVNALTVATNRTFNHLRYRIRRRWRRNRSPSSPPPSLRDLPTLFLSVSLSLTNIPSSLVQELAIVI